MRMSKSFFLTGVLAFGLAAVPARADATLYNNDFGGVISGDNYDEDAWNITTFSISDSFSLTSQATLTGFTIAILPDTQSTQLTSLSWAITTAPFGGVTLDFGTSVSPTSQAIIETNSQGYTILSETFSISPGLPLAGGITYWLQLDDAIPAPSFGNAMYWDQSDGPSTAYQTPFTGELPDGGACNAPCTGSESFFITGVPEPSSVILMVTILLGVAFGARKRITGGLSTATRTDW
jgi:hypothetical protein